MSLATRGIDAFGIDVSEEAITSAQNRSHGCVGSGKFRRSTLGEVAGEYDVITFVDTFEHMHNPRHELRLAVDRLSVHGAIIVFIPFCDSYYYRMCKLSHKLGWSAPLASAWASNNPYPHLFLPSRAGAKIVATDLGLSLEMRRLAVFGDRPLTTSSLYSSFSYFLAQCAFSLGPFNSLCIFRRDR